MNIQGPDQCSLLGGTVDLEPEQRTGPNGSSMYHVRRK
jgi:hypothetical protein